MLMKNNKMIARIENREFDFTECSKKSVIYSVQLPSTNIYMLFAGREVRIGKNCARGLEYGARGPCTQVPRTQDRGHSFSQYGPT